MHKDLLDEPFFSFDYPGDDTALNSVLRSVSTTVLPTVSDPDFSLLPGYSEKDLNPNYNSSVDLVIQGAKEYVTECWSALSIQEQQLKASPFATCSTKSDNSSIQEALSKLELLVKLLDNFARLAVKSNTRNITYRDREKTVDQMHQVAGEMRGLIEYLEPIVRDSAVKAC